jgi:hypothetical protein
MALLPGGWLAARSVAVGGEYAGLLNGFLSGAATLGHSDGRDIDRATAWRRSYRSGHQSGLAQLRADPLSRGNKVRASGTYWPQVKASCRTTGRGRG